MNQRLQQVESRLHRLMLLGLDGDVRAQGELLTDMGAYLRAYFGRRLKDNPADVEDLVQETLLALHCKRRTYDRVTPFTAWAYALARYRLLEHLRRAHRHVFVPIEDAGDLYSDQDPEEGAVRQDLTNLLMRLTRRQRGLVVDVKLWGLSIAQAAASQGMTTGAAKIGLHRGLEAMKKAVRDEDC